MNRPYNVFFDNVTGRVVLQKKINLNNRNLVPQRTNDEDFENKINKLYKIINVDCAEKINIEKEDKKIEHINVNIKEQIKDELDKNKILFEKYPKNIIEAPIIKNNNICHTILSENKITKESFNESINNKSVYKKDLLYGIKKTSLSDFNYLNNSSNSNDFRIGINKNFTKNDVIFDCFYLFPNISEINSKIETNIINEKKVELFKNMNNNNDIQYFPIDFVACGITIPLKSHNSIYTKLKIKNIFWNIFQSIDLKKYSKDELLCIVPNKNEFIYKPIKLQINFELHSQVSGNLISSTGEKILPYRNFEIRSNTPANSCLFKTEALLVDTLNGSIFDNIEINILPELNIQCALLCVKISVPYDSTFILNGIDKNNKLTYGTIPFSQFIINFEYELV